jgi:hypothetical protein
MKAADTKTLAFCQIKVFGFSEYTGSVNSAGPVYGNAVSSDVDIEDNIWVSNDAGFVFK